jgi:hypothetical protein
MHPIDIYTSKTDYRRGSLYSVCKHCPCHLLSPFNLLHRLPTLRLQGHGQRSVLNGCRFLCFFSFKLYCCWATTRILTQPLFALVMSSSWSVPSVAETILDHLRHLARCMSGSVSPFLHLLTSTKRFHRYTALKPLTPRLSFNFSFFTFPSHSSH